MITNEQKNIIKGLFEEPKVYKLRSYEETLQLRKKAFRDIKIRRLKGELFLAIKALETAIDIYRELKNKTEYWDGKETHNFNKKGYFTIRKVNGKITRYYNELYKLYRNLEEIKINKKEENYEKNNNRNHNH